MNIRFILLLICSALIFNACKDDGLMRYGKVLKSKSIDEKFKYAVLYYDSGECYKALPLFDELIGLVRGTDKYEDVYYYYAKTHYCIEDFYLANYYSKNFARTFTNSPRSEELLFLSAMSSYRNSPKPSLDQRDTEAAINEFQFFLDNYPNSNLKDSCENMMLRLNYKLEKKAFDIAELYVKTEKYKSATISLDNMLERYPDSQFREDLYFLRIKAWYEYAAASIDSKQSERFDKSLSYYRSFISAYPSSSFMTEAESFYLKAIDQMKTSVETKDMGMLEELNLILKSEESSIDKKYETMTKIKSFYKPLQEDLINVAEIQMENENYGSAISTLDKAKKDFEYESYPIKVSYMLLKSQYNYAVTSDISKKTDRYKEYIKTYSTFVSAFPDSTYIDEANDWYKKANAELAKLESNTTEESK